ncbi:MAG: type III PLP-dependent enzyme [Desulfobacteraceae bacterium]
MNTIHHASMEQGAFYRELVREHGSPLLVLDADTVRQQYHGLRRALPAVEIYYAVKSLPHPAILRLLAGLGSGFDLASSGEIELIRNMRISARRTIHSHPIKRDSDIRDGLRFGCTTYVVDNTDELLKFVPYKHRVGLFIRISFRSASAVVDLSKKFGCALEEAHELLTLAAKLGIHVKGLCFHVGSQCTDAGEQIEAIHACNTLIRRHHDTGAAPVSTLDIGGGFPIAYDGGQVDIESYCAPIRHALAGLPAYVSVIAEPGRFISGPSMTCVATVIGKALRSGLHWYYLDDGVYGSFSGQIYDHVRYPLEVYSDDERRYAGVLAGPTCDSIDVIAEDVQLPFMHLGDQVVGRMMGAYTAASASDFNLLRRAKVVVINDGTAAALPVSAKQRPMDKPDRGGMMPSPHKDLRVPF